MIQLLSIKLENFLSHKDTYLDLTKKSDLVLIEGKNYDGRYDSNGSGKSTILEGLVYALSGNTLRGVGVNDVVNRQAGKDTRVTLELSVEGVRYVVKRHRAHTVDGDSLQLFRDAEDITKRLNKDTQTLLDDIVGVPYNVLISVLFLGEGLSAKFTQLSDPDKKAIIESTLSLSHDFNSIRDVVNRELKSIKSTIDTETGKAQGIQRVLEGVDPKDKVSPEELALLDKKILDSNLEYARLYGEYTEVANKVSFIERAITDYDRDIRKLKDYDSQLEKLDAQRKSIESSTNPICPQCNQELRDHGAKDTTLSHISKQIDSIADWRTPLSESVSKISDIDVAKDTAQNLRDKCVHLSMILQEMHAENSSLANHKSTLEAKKEVYEKLSSYERELEDIKGRVETLNVSLFDHSYLYNLFSPTGLIVYILEESVQYINDRLKLYSAVLLDKSYEIIFKKGKISLLDSGGSTYQSLSNGEKRRLDIAIQFSLHDYVTTYCGKSIDTIFIDEVLDTLDSIGVRNILEVLRMKLEYCNADRIYLITHNNDIKSQVDSFITVSKDSEGISRILEEVTNYA